MDDAAVMYQVYDGESVPLDAHYELEDGDIVFHSRGGTKKSGNARNTDYGTALRLLLARIVKSPITIVDAWVDSKPMQALPIDQRRILDRHDISSDPETLYKVMSRRMPLVRPDSGASKTGGNPTKRIRIKLAHKLTPQKLNSVLGGKEVNENLHSRGLLPTADLEKIGDDHVWRAVQKLLSGYTDHGFSPSTDYDLIADGGQRLPPKAVFGVAATEALGFKVLPEHFHGGVGTPCFKILTRAEFKIVPKGEAPPPEDTEWIEGKRRLVLHARAERAPGLSQAKKANFKREHGKLFCEHCQMDPVAQYGGPHGESCIEVHHHKIAIEEMGEGHKTRLEDLLCLCANCHRIVHRQMRDGTLKTEG